MIPRCLSFFRFSRSDLRLAPIGVRGQPFVVQSLAVDIFAQAVLSTEDRRSKLQFRRYPQQEPDIAAWHGPEHG
jgi:hypothetical protein